MLTESRVRRLTGPAVVLSLAGLCIGAEPPAPAQAGAGAPSITSRPRLLERVYADLYSRQDQPAFCFVENPTPEQLADIMQKYGALPPAQFLGGVAGAGGFGPRYFSDNPVWVGNGSQSSSGQATRCILTYSFPADGVGWGSGGSSANDLSARLTTLLGVGNLDRGRELLRQALASWRRFNGISYTEVADDNSAFSQSSGHLAQRGDIRIGSVPQTVNGVLAYDFYPSGGADMTINSDYFPGAQGAFANSLNSYRYLRNVVTHEHGHGLGFIHPTPCDHTKIMEPFINTNFDGIQIDELRGASRNYGDKYAGNSSGASAVDFGNLTSPTVKSVIERNLSTNGSAGPNGSSADWFKFTLSSAQNVVITVAPTGGSYPNGSQTSGCEPSAPGTVVASSAGNLNVELRTGANGATVSQTASAAAAGATEILTANALAAGTYWVRVVDVGPNANQTVQLYDMTIRVGTAKAPPVAIAGLPKRVQADTNCFFMGDINSYATESGAVISSYAWDRDGDGTFESSVAQPGGLAFPSNGVFNATLRVTDSNGLSATDTIPVTVFGASAVISSVVPSSSQVNVTIPVIINGKNLKGVTSSSQFAVSGSGVGIIGTPVPNALGTQVTGLSFVIGNAGAGTRTIAVSNSDGSGTSSGNVTSGNIFTLTGSCIAPTINSSPATQNTCIGGTVSFSVGASGTGLSYQWRKGSNPISGANLPTLTIGPAVAGDAATYDCVVTGGCGTATSNGATLTVDPAQITTNPSPVTSCVGGTIFFSIGADGVSGFQWRKNSQNIPGANGLDLVISPVSVADIGLYDCVVTVPCGTLTSTPASLTVPTPPTISGPPADQAVCPGAGATFVVSASGLSLNYQWRKNGTNIGGANSPTLNLSNVGAANVASYDCRVSNNCGFIDSPPANLSLLTTTSIGTQPLPQSACVGGSATFTVGATGSSLTYQWRKNTAAVQGATAPTLTINPVAAGDAGNYDCVVTGTCGAPTTDSVALAVGDAVQITGQPGLQAVCEGGTASFGVITSGTPTGYQWRRNTQPIGGATGSTITINPVTGADVGNYDCVVSTTCGNIISDAAPLSASAPVTINSASGSASVCQGGSITISVGVTGSSPTYQWRKDTQPIGGATSNTLTINPAALTDAGSYDCIVGGACGGGTTVPAVITVCSPITIDTSPAGLTACPGQNVTLTVAATGTSVSYQWRKGGGNIGGATGPSLNIPSAGRNDPGSYDCVVSNCCQSVPSAPAVLAVCLADFDCSHTVTVGDIFSFLTAWFAGDPRTDFDGFGGTTVADIFGFLTAWFAGC